MGEVKPLINNVKPKSLRVPVREQDPHERASNFDEVCYGYNLEEAIEESKRCLSCKNAKCVGTCPVGINIPGFIKKIVEKDIEGAGRIIAESSALPAVCGRVCPQESQCEMTCIMGIKNEPVSSKHSETILDKEKVDGHSAKTAVYEFLKGLFDDIQPEDQSNHVLKGQVAGLLTKAVELVSQVKEEGVKASLVDEVKNLKAAFDKEGADLDELNTQVQDLLKRISLTIQKESQEEAQDPQLLALYQQLYNGIIALHSYLEMNHGSDADFEKVDALFDKLAAASKDKQALLAVAQEIVLLNQEFQSKVKPAEASTETANTETNDKQAESNLTPATSSPETREKVAE